MRTWLIFLCCFSLSQIVFAQTATPPSVPAMTPPSVSAMTPQGVKALPDDPACTELDRVFMKRAFESARDAVKKGGGPFGAVLVKDGKEIAEYGNTIGTTHDITKHAETGLISAFSPKIDYATFAACTLYASSEPCTMCSGAIRFAGIGRVVYGVTETQFLRAWGFPVDERPLTCKEVFARTSPGTVVLGPLMEEEGLQTHLEFEKEHPFHGKR